MSKLPEEDCKIKLKPPRKDSKWHLRGFFFFLLFCYGGRGSKRQMRSIKEDCEKKNSFFFLFSNGQIPSTEKDQE